MTGVQQVLLVTLRTLIGWHFLYEGYVKLVTPGWGADGLPVAAWSSAGYLRGATGPFASLFHALASPASIGTVDTIVAVALALVGLGLMLGLLTQVACAGGITLLALFYVSAIPLDGLPGPRVEGAYLIVNKNLIECAALAVVLAFKTGRIAGLDRWFQVSRAGRSPAASTGAAA
jgi:thiosulfate dehydrogenase [quinone] large subunit